MKDNIDKGEDFSSLSQCISLTTSAEAKRHASIARILTGSTISPSSLHSLLTGNEFAKQQSVLASSRTAWQVQPRLFVAATMTAVSVVCLSSARFIHRSMSLQVSACNTGNG